MDDDLKLVEDLSTFAGGLDYPEADRLVRKAAAAITRLHGCRTAYQDTIDGLVKKRDEALAEIARRDELETAFRADEIEGLAKQWPRVVKTMLDAERRAETAEAHAKLLMARVSNGEINTSAIYNLMRGFLDQPAFYPEWRAELLRLSMKGWTP